MPLPAYLILCIALYGQVKPYLILFIALYGQVKPYLILIIALYGQVKPYLVLIIALYGQVKVVHPPDAIPDMGADPYFTQGANSYYVIT